MPINKTLLNFIVDDGLLKRIEDFRFKNRFATRAAAIKWLLDWALKQKPSAKNLLQESEEEHDIEPPRVEPPRIEPARQTPPPEAAQREPVMASARESTRESTREPTRESRELSRASMTQALRDQGYEVGDTAHLADGRERILVRSVDGSAWVDAVQELQDLAAARITLGEIYARRAAGK